MKVPRWVVALLVGLLLNMVGGVLGAGILIGKVNGMQTQIDKLEHRFDEFEQKFVKP